jgi:hypothetical protein
VERVLADPEVEADPPGPPPQERVVAFAGLQHVVVYLAGAVDVRGEAVLARDLGGYVGVRHPLVAARLRAAGEAVGQVEPGQHQLVPARGALLDRHGGHLSGGDDHRVTLRAEGHLYPGTDREQAAVEELEMRVVEVQREIVRKLDRLLDPGERQLGVHVRRQRPAVHRQHHAVETPLLSHGDAPAARG